MYIEGFLLSRMYFLQVIDVNAGNLKGTYYIQLESGALKKI